KPFGIHAGERDPDDIDGALAYDPDYLVHMVHARDDDFEVLENEGIPVAVCPRCNLVIPNVDLPPVKRLVEHTTVALGTDNVMLNSASMWREMEFASKLFDVPDEEVLRMATVNGARLVGRDDVGVVEEGKRARLVVLDGSKPKFEDSHDLVATVVRRSGPEDVKRVVLR
ncbi:MAG: amidohydrolase family protein, partial [Halobacteria archaeon]|nr:amidohydrolase family protein [Halobacteria archaeon]